MTLSYQSSSVREGLAYSPGALILTRLGHGREFSEAITGSFATNTSPGHLLIINEYYHLEVMIRLCGCF